MKLCFNFKRPILSPSTAKIHGLLSSGSRDIFLVGNDRSMAVLVKRGKNTLKIPKELEVKSDDSDSLVITKVFLVENVLLQSLIRIKTRTSEVIEIEVGEVATDDVLQDPYSFAPGSEKFKSYFKKFYKFKNLKPVELSSVIDLKLYQVLPDMFQDTANSNKDFLKVVDETKKSLYKKTALVLFNLSEKTKKSLIDVVDGKYVYSLLSSIVNIEVNTQPIDTGLVLKEIELSKEIPIAYTIDPVTFKPLVKVWNGLPKEQLKKFLLSETKVEAGKVNIRRPKGLTFKILGNSGEYLTVFLSKYFPRLSLRCNWNTEDTASFSDIKAYIKHTKLLIKQIQDISGVNDFKPEVNIKYAKILCKIKQASSIKNVIKAYGKERSNLTLMSSTDTDIIFTMGNVNVDLKLVKGDNSMSIAVSGAKQETQLFDVIDSIVNILNLTEGKTSQKIKEKTEKPFGKKCQTDRRPSLLKGSGEVVKTYFIETSEGKVVCNGNPKYQYPGYTSKNDICCFSKDQRNKPNFGSAKSGRKIYFSDENILSNAVILTDKILQNGRLGAMPKNIQNYFSDDFNRMGVFEGSLINCIGYLINGTITRKNLTEYFSKELAESLDIDFVETMKHIRYCKILDHRRVIGILQKMTSKNVIVITDTSIYCENTSFFEFKEFLLIYKNQKFYEPLVKTIDYKTLQKIFTRKDLVEFLKIYDASCQINFSPSTVVYSYNRLKEIVNVKGQILSENGAATFVVTPDGILPIIVSPVIYGVKILKLKDSVVEPRKQCSLLNSTSEIAYECVGQILKNGLVVALLTGSKIIVPVKESSALKNVPVVTDLEYVENFNFKSSQVDKSLETMNEEREFQRLRYSISSILKNNTEVHSKLMKTKKSLNLVYTEKVNVVQKILKELLQVKKYLKKLSLDILNNNDILRGNVRIDSMDSRNFIIRPTETVLATQEELDNYFKE